MMRSSSRSRQRFWRMTSAKMPETNIVQAMVPEGARVLENRSRHRARLCSRMSKAAGSSMLPGVPREMRGLTNDTVIPLLRERVGAVTDRDRLAHAAHHRHRRVRAGREARRSREGRRWLAARVSSRMGRSRPAPHLERTPRRSRRARAGCERAQASRRRSAAWSTARSATIWPRSCSIRVARGASRSPRPRAARAGCSARGSRRIPGSSDVYVGGVVAYDNAVKSKLLGVSDVSLEEHGAVSERGGARDGRGMRARARNADRLRDHRRGRTRRRNAGEAGGNGLDRRGGRGRNENVGPRLRWRSRRDTAACHAGRARPASSGVGTASSRQRGRTAVAPSGKRSEITTMTLDERRPQHRMGHVRDDFDPPNGPAASRDDAADGMVGDENDTTNTSAAAPDAQRELDEQRDRYLRLAAEYDNYRKRSIRERQEAGARAQGELVKSLIDSLDDLQRVTAQDPEIVDAKTIHQGIEVVDKKLMKALSAAGPRADRSLSTRRSIRRCTRRCPPSRRCRARTITGVARVSAGLSLQRSAAAAGARGREAVERMTRH